MMDEYENCKRCGAINDKEDLLPAPDGGKVCYGCFASIGRETPDDDLGLSMSGGL